MKKHYINALILIFIIIITAFGALYAGQKFMSGRHGDAGHSPDTHGYLHNQLNTTDEQDKKLVEVEKQFQQRRQYLEESIRLANMELADSIKKYDSYSPQVQQAVDKIHKFMGELQKTTLVHLFAMKPILNKEQNQELQRLITDALYENARK